MVLEDFGGESLASVLATGSVILSEFLNIAIAIIKASEGESNAEQKIYELDWNPILKDNIVTKILLVVRDVTELRELEIASEKQRQELEIIQEIINLPANKFDSMIATCYRFIKENREIIHQRRSFELESIQHLFRNMHTMKGLSRSCNLRTLSEAIHIAEQFYSDSIKAKAWEPSLMLEALDNTQHIVDCYQQTNLEKLGRTPEDNNKLTIIRKSVENSLKILSNIDSSGLSTDGKVEIETVRQLLKELAGNSLEQVLSLQVNAAASLAIELGKAEPQFVFEDPGFGINQQAHELINNVFTHLIRNSIDHGLELTQERVDAGKPAQGKLALVLEEKNNQLQIKFSDDGRGLNLPAIYQSALEKGLVNESSPVTPEQVANLIFTSGFSTAKQVSDISGRGIGMDAVKSFLENEDCSIQIKIFDPKIGGLTLSAVEFIVTLPRKFFQHPGKQAVSLPENLKKAI